MPFSFLHAADLHLDTPHEGLAIRDPALRQRLVDASLDALDALVAEAIARRALFVALAGDVYDGAERGIRAQVRLLDACKRLDAAGIWTFIAHGNHDPVSEGWSAVSAWPSRVRLFPAHEAATFELTAPDGSRVTVTGTSFPRRDVRTGLHTRFTRPAGPGFHVAVLHANVGAAAEHEPYSPCRLEDLVELGFDAWLLGHVHRRQVLRAQAPFVAYPGNLQGRSFKPSERGPKGAWWVTVEGGEVSSAFLPLAPVRFEEVELDVGPWSEVGDVVDALVEIARRWAPDTVVARARLLGRSDLYDACVDDPDGASLLAALRDRAPGAPGVHWVSVEVAVRPHLDLDALRQREDLSGTLIAESDRALGDLVAVRAALAAQPGLRDALRDLSDDDLAAIMLRATDLALHHLDGEG
jgi:DNA repair exonuclease SbcCD nuclease subunit